MNYTDEKAPLTAIKALVTDGQAQELADRKAAIMPVAEFSF